MNRQESDRELTGTASDSAEDRHAADPRAGSRGVSSEEIDLIEVWDVLRAQRWTILAILVVFVAAAATYLAMATKWYETSVVLVPTSQELSSGLGGQLGSLASVVGIRLGSGNAEEPLAVLRSRAFAREFVASLNLVPVFFADEWDAKENRWQEADPDKWPDERDAVTFFHKKVFRVHDDVNSGIVTITIRWTDPDASAQWADILVESLNQRMRSRALAETTQHLEFLKAQLASTTVVTLQQTIGRIMEAELQKAMLANSNRDFAFRAVGSAERPKLPYWPNSILILVISFVSGLAFALAVVGLHRALLAVRRRASTR